MGMIHMVEASAHKCYKISDLKERDRKEVEFWIETIEDQIDSCLFDYPLDPNLPEVIEKIMAGIAEDFVDELKEYLVAHFKDVVISIIDNYEDEE